MTSETVRTHLERTVIEIMGRLVMRSPGTIGPDDSLLNDLHLDSLHVLELLTLLEERFGFETEAEDLQADVFRTVSSVIEFVRERAEAR